jgi:Ion transport protein
MDTHTHTHTESVSDRRDDHSDTKQQLIQLHRLPNSSSTESNAKLNVDVKNNGHSHGQTLHRRVCHATSLAQVDPVSASVAQFADTTRLARKSTSLKLGNSFKLDPSLPRQFPEPSTIAALTTSQAQSAALYAAGESLDRISTLRGVHHTNRHLYVTANILGDTCGDVLHRYSWYNLEKNGGAAVADSSVSGVLDALSAGHVNEDDVVQMIHDQTVQRAKIQVAPSTPQLHTINAHICVTPVGTVIRDCEPLPEHIRERIVTEHYEPRYQGSSYHNGDRPQQHAAKFHSAKVVHHYPTEESEEDRYRFRPDYSQDFVSCDTWLHNPLLAQSDPETKDTPQPYDSRDNSTVWRNSTAWRSKSPVAPLQSHYLRCEIECQPKKLCTWYYANPYDEFQTALQILLFRKTLVAVFKHGITILSNFLDISNVPNVSGRSESSFRGTRLHIPAEPDSKLAKYLRRNASISHNSRNGNILQLYEYESARASNRNGFVIKLDYEWKEVKSMDHDPDMRPCPVEDRRTATCNTLPYKIDCFTVTRNRGMDHTHLAEVIGLDMQPSRVVMNVACGDIEFTDVIVSSNDEVLCMWRTDMRYGKFAVYKLREQLKRAFTHVRLPVPSIRHNINVHHLWCHPTSVRSASFSDNSERVAVLYENSGNTARAKRGGIGKTCKELSLTLAVYDMHGQVISDVTSLLDDMYDHDCTFADSLSQMRVQFAPGSATILVCVLEHYICTLDTDAHRVVWRHRHTYEGVCPTFSGIWVIDSQASCVVMETSKAYDSVGSRRLPIMFTRLYTHSGDDEDEDVVFQHALEYPACDWKTMRLTSVSLRATAEPHHSHRDTNRRRVLQDQFTLYALVEDASFRGTDDSRVTEVDVDRRHIRQQHEEERKAQQNVLEQAEAKRESLRDREKRVKLSLQPYTFPSDAELTDAFGARNARVIKANGLGPDMHIFRLAPTFSANGHSIRGGSKFASDGMIDRGRGERVFSESGKCTDLRTGSTLWDNASVTDRYGKVVAASPDGTWLLRVPVVELYEHEHFKTVSPVLCDGHTGLPIRRLFDQDGIELKYLRLQVDKPAKDEHKHSFYRRQPDVNVDEIESLLLQALEAAHSPAETKADHNTQSGGTAPNAPDVKHNAADKLIQKPVAKCYATYALLFHACYRGNTAIAIACIELGGLNPLWTPPAGTTQNGQRAHALAIAIAFKHGSLVLRLITHISSADRLHPRRLAPIMRVFDFADIRSRHAPESAWSGKRLPAVSNKAPADDDAPPSEPDIFEAFWTKAVTSSRKRAPPLSCFEVLADKYPGALMSLLEHTSNADVSRPCLQPSAAPREPLLLIPLPLFSASGATVSAVSQQPQLVRAHMRTLDYNASDTNSVHSIWHQDIEATKENAPDPDSLVTVRARHVVSGLPLTGWNQPSRPLLSGRSAGVPDPHTTDTTGLISAREYLQHHPLDALLKSGLKSAFGTECVRRAVDYKWTAFARQLYLQRMATYLLFLLCYVLATVQFGFEPYSVIWDRDEFTDVSGQDVIHSQWVWSCVRVLLEAAVLAFGVHYALVEYHQFRREPSAKAYLTDPWNILDVTSCVLIAVLVPLHIADSTHRFPVQSVLSVLLWVKSLHYARGFFSTGPFIRMLVEIGAGTTSFMLILIVVLCGFAQAFLLVFHSPDNVNAFASDYASWTVLLRVYQLMLGDADMDEIRAADFPGMAIALFVAFTLIVVILMLNLLIALMSSIFERVHENVESEWYLERTEIILELERSHIQQYIDDDDASGGRGHGRVDAILPATMESAALRSVSPADNPYLPYLHVLQMVDESDEVHKPGVPVSRAEFLDRTSVLMENQSQTNDAVADAAAAVDEKMQRMETSLNQKLQLLLDELKRQSEDHIPHIVTLTESDSGNQS